MILNSTWTPATSPSTALNIQSSQTVKYSTPTIIMQEGTELFLREEKKMILIRLCQSPLFDIS
jgi:hypothetical protein